MYTIYKITNEFILTLPSRNLKHIAELLEILVINYKFAQTINGIFIYDKILDSKVISINKDLDIMMKKVVLAHELGHAILHPFTNRFFIEKYTLYNKNRFELEANIFAANLLIPDNVVNHFKVNSLNINNIARELNVPTELLKLKLKYMDITIKEGENK